MGSSRAAAQKPVLHWQPHSHARHKCLYSRHIINTPHKRSLRLTSTSPEPRMCTCAKGRAAAKARKSARTERAKAPPRTAARSRAF
eukprot:scaffold3060_cov121-Isochrysis_galbana.AAC.2